MAARGTRRKATRKKAARKRRGRVGAPSFWERTFRVTDPETGARETVSAEDRVLSLLAEGRSLLWMQRRGIVSRSTVLRRVWRDAQFRDRYARAREAGQDALADDVLDISDGGERASESGEVQGDDSARVQRDRLKCDARRWHAAKVAPTKYGDRVQLAGEVATGRSDPLDGLDDDARAEVAATARRLARLGPGALATDKDGTETVH